MTLRVRQSTIKFLHVDTFTFKHVVLEDSLTLMVDLPSESLTIQLSTKRFTQGNLLNSQEIGINRIGNLVKFTQRVEKKITLFLLFSILVPKLTFQFKNLKRWMLATLKDIEILYFASSQ